MKDLLAHLEKLRAQIAECERLERAAKRQTKRDIFKRLVTHYKVMACELEQAITKQAKEG